VDVRHWLVTVINVALGVSTAAILAVAIVGPGSLQTPASAAQRIRPAGEPRTVPTAPRSTTTVTGTTVTTRTTLPATTLPATTLPPTTVPHTTTTTKTTPPSTAPRPTYVYPLYTVPFRTVPSTTTTSTTIAPIGGRIPVPPSTLPLSTKAQSAHVSPVFAALSGAGFFVAFVIMASRFVLTRPGRTR